MFYSYWFTYSNSLHLTSCCCAKSHGPAGALHGRGRGVPCMFPSLSLVTGQNLVTLYYTVRAYVVSSKNLGGTDVSENV